MASDDEVSDRILAVLAESDDFVPHDTLVRLAGFSPDEEPAVIRVLSNLERWKTIKVNAGREYKLLEDLP
jgi:hypothetical protein